MTIRTQRSFNFYSHLAGVSAAGTVFLALVARYSISSLIIALIYGNLILFLFSEFALPRLQERRK